MQPDEHGTPSGAKAHWLSGEKPCEPCRLAASRERKRNRYLELIGRSATVPSVGTVRRIRALMAIGWTQPQIAEAAGISLATLRSPLWRPDGSVYRGTHEAVAEAYERMCMKLPPRRTVQEKRCAALSRSLASKHGWLPPLAYDDIDTDPEPTTVRDIRPARDDVDEAVVLRVMAGERLPMTTGERVEVVARLRARGWSLNEIETRTPIGKADRYTKRGAA